MIIDSIAKLAYQAANKLGSLTRGISARGKTATQTDNQSQSASTATANDGAQVVMPGKSAPNRNEVNSLCKIQDVPQRRSVFDRTESQTPSTSANRWKLGRYSPQNSRDSVTDLVSPFSNATQISKTIDRSSVRTLDPVESLNVIMSSQLKLKIIDSYKQSAGEKLEQHNASKFEAFAKSDNFFANSSNPSTFLFHASGGSSLLGAPESSKTAIEITENVTETARSVTETARTVTETARTATEITRTASSLSVIDSPFQKLVFRLRSFSAVIAAEQQLPEFRTFAQGRINVAAISDMIATNQSNDSNNKSANIQTNFEHVAGILAIEQSATKIMDAEMDNWPESDCTAEDSMDKDRIEEDLSENQQLTSESPTTTGNDFGSTSKFAPAPELPEAHHASTAAELEWLKYILSPEANSDTLRRLAESSDTTPFILGQLAFHSDVDVRCAVADHVNTPHETHWILAEDNNPTVRYITADNINAPVEVLTVLTKDSNTHIAARARRTLKRLRGNVRFASFKDGNALHRSAS